MHPCEQFSQMFLSLPTETRWCLMLKIKVRNEVSRKWWSRNDRQYKRTRNAIERKYDIVRTYPEFIHNQLPDYRPFLTTFTFNNSNKELPIDCYHDYFKFFYRKLCQNLINRKANYKKPSLILIPENSYQCVDDRRHACTHFHGFLMIHNQTLEKFNKKCVVYEYNISNQLLLHPRLLNPYSLQAKITNQKKLSDKGYLFMREKTLEYESIDVRKPDTIKDVMKFANYSCKNFIKSSFKDTDMMLFSRNHDTQTHK